MAALAFEREDCIDHVFKHARSSDTAVLRHVADEHERCPAFLGKSNQFLCRSADLADRSRRTFDQIAVHRLNGIDHQHGRWINVAVVADETAISTGVLLEALLKRLPLKEAVACAVEISGRPRNEVYRAALALRPGGEPG